MPNVVVQNTNLCWGILFLLLLFFLASEESLSLVLIHFLSVQFQKFNPTGLNLAQKWPHWLLPNPTTFDRWTLKGSSLCNIICSFSLFDGLLSGLGSLLRMFCFRCFTSAVNNKLNYTGNEHSEGCSGYCQLSRNQYWAYSKLSLRLNS